MTQPPLPDTAPKPKPMDARTLLGLLRRHFIGPEEFPGGVFLPEVQLPHDGTIRRADAVYLSFVASRGLGIDVCELKVSRSDFMAELNHPVKAEAWWPHSTRWWIVSPSPEITPPDLLPDGWGLMCPPSRGRRFKVHRQPSVREPVVTLRLLIEIAKKMDTLRAQAERAAREETRVEWQRRLDEVRQERIAKASALTADEKARLDAVAEVEKAAGVKLTPGMAFWSQWNRELTPAQFGEAMRIAAEGVVARDHARDRVLRLREQLRTARVLLDRYDDELATAERAFAGEGEQQSGG